MKSGIKQNIVLGSDFLTDLRKLKVLILNVNWTSIEIARNLCLLNIGMITLFDKAVVLESDLVLSFLYRPEDVGRPKAEVVRTWLQPMCVATLVEKVTADLGETQGPIKDHDVIILADAGSFATLRKVEETCIKQSKKFIYVSTNELYAAAFFNFLFIESRVRFNHINNLNIQSLSYDKEGVLSFDRKHPFQRGDFVTVEGLEDTKGFNNDEVRPVVWVVDDYSVRMEDQSSYTRLGNPEPGSAVVYGVNYPTTYRAKSVQQQMAMTENDFGFFNPRLDNGFRFISPYLKYRDAVKNGNFESKETAFKSLYTDDKMVPVLNVFREKIINRDVDKPRRLLPLENSLIAGLASFEVLKVNGLYLPQKAPVFLPALSLDFLFDKRLMIFGCGAKTHEFLKILFVETQLRAKEYVISVFDDNVVTTDHSQNYFFACHTSINMTKSACLVKEVNARKGFLKVKEVDRNQTYKAVNNADIVVITFDNYLAAYEFADMTTCIKKPLFVLTEHLGEFVSLYLTDTTLPTMEGYYVNTADPKKVNQKGLDYAETSADVAKWTGLLFEFVFEHFVVEGDLFRNSPRNFPFHYLILLLKSQFYEFLMTQSPKEGNLVIEGVLIFKIIFSWYIEKVVQASAESGLKVDIQPLDFDFDNPLHREFVVAFVGMFKGVFVPAAPKMDDKQVLEILLQLEQQALPRLPEMTFKQIEESYKANLKKVVKSEKYFRSYKIRHDLTEFDKVKAFANALYQLKLGVFELKAKNRNEFDYYFFNEQWSLPTDGAILAGLLVHHMAELGKEGFRAVLSMDPSNCKSAIF